MSSINEFTEMTKTIDVSVVIPCFNSSKTIIRCLDSVAVQTVQAREIIVVDDGSEDKVESLISIWRAQNNIPLYFIRQKNLGAPAARNAGIRAAKSRYIALLDADDIWLPAKLEIQQKIMEKDSLTLCGHGYLFHAKDLNSKILDIKMSNLKAKKLSLCSFAYKNPLFTPTVMFDRVKFTGFDERFRRGDDYKAWLENFERDRYGYINHVLAAGFKRPIGESGLTASINIMHKEYVNVLKNLYAEKTIGLSFLYSALAIEYAKYPFRCIYSKFLSR
jgi:glycosyltransferase involved in cell wall biosynthesis